ncbi:MAG TPA: hypothetical protein VH210_03135 [Gaiellaceae bacterium]|nr:hypothetical protein [Gaiellaceae bacterium]
MHDPQFALTLPHLQRVYTLNHCDLVRSAHAGSLDAAEAHALVQSAFARAAKIRFRFRSERHVVSWLREELGISPASLSAVPEPHPQSPADWEDVLQRAQIVDPSAGAQRDDQ